MGERRRKRVAGGKEGKKIKGEKIRNWGEVLTCGWG